LTTSDLKKDDQLDNVFLLTKEGFARGAHIELRDRQDATSRYILAALLTENDSIIGAIRRELRRIVDVLVDDEHIVKVLREEVIKRETLEGPSAETAVRRCCRVEAKKLRKPKDETASAVDGPAASSEEAASAGE
jgi:hypothetical protein